MTLEGRGAWSTVGLLSSKHGWCARSPARQEWTLSLMSSVTLPAFPSCLSLQHCSCLLYKCPGKGFDMSLLSTLFSFICVSFDFIMKRQFDELESSPPFLPALSSHDFKDLVWFTYCLIIFVHLFFHWNVVLLGLNVVISYWCWIS